MTRQHYWKLGLAGLLAAIAIFVLINPAHASSRSEIKKMIVEEDKQYSKDYLDPNKRSIANAIQIYFKDGSKTEKIAIEYPLGHRQRREEGIPILLEKFQTNLATCFAQEKAAAIFKLCQDPARLQAMPVDEFMGLLVSL